jgi:hypothetical protein
LGHQERVDRRVYRPVWHHLLAWGRQERVDRRIYRPVWPQPQAYQLAWHHLLAWGRQERVDQQAYQPVWWQLWARAQLRVQEHLAWCHFQDVQL